MAKTTDTIKELEGILMTMKEQLKTLTPGSEDYGRQIKGICELQHELTEHKKAVDLATKNEAERDEQKRMNEYEIYFKEKQVEIENTRTETMMKAEKAKRCDNLIINGLRLLFDGYREVKYEDRWQQAMAAEYGISEGASVIPVTSVTRILTEDKPKRLG